MRQQGAQRVVDGDRTVRATDSDVDVEPEGVVPPDDVAEQLAVPAVVRRVDDPLVLPAAPRVRSSRAECEPEAAGQLRELGAARAHQLCGRGEAHAGARAHLDLGGDQLADQVLVDRRPGCGRLHFLEPVDERERVGVEERELLLDRDGQVDAAVEGRPSLLEQHLVRNLLRFTH
jgi:hypothetical protein